MTDRDLPVVVLDRDGTIVIDKYYLGDPEGLEFAPGAELGLRHLAKLGCRIVVVTNQSGVGRGILTLEQVHRVNHRLVEMMHAIGAQPERVYYCPHSPNDLCKCRKPAAGLFLQAAAELGFDPARSFAIGDKLTDVEFGERVGATTMMIFEKPISADNGCKPDYLVTGLDEAARIIECLIEARVLAI